LHILKSLRLAFQLHLSELAAHSEKKVASTQSQKLPGGQPGRNRKVLKEEKMNKSRRLVILFCLSVCAAAAPSAALAQSASAATPSNSFNEARPKQSETPAPGDELAASGTIQEIISTNTPGTPRGLRMILIGPQGVIDASLGPYLTSVVQQSLTAGQLVAVDGVAVTLNGHDYLLVRQLTIGDHQIGVRNDKGFLIHPASNHARQATITKGEGQ
jgi:hypothetical protein